MTRGSSKVVDIDRGYDALMRDLAFQGMHVEVGVRDDGRQPDLPMLAAVHEFGNSHVPERSFLRATVDGNRARYGRLLREAAHKIVHRRAKPVNALSKVGRTVVFDVQRRISSRIDPPNAPSTIAAKGSDVPLVDTGRLRASIDFEVTP